MKNKDIAEARIEAVSYPNKGHFSVPETGQRGIVKNVIPGQKVLFRVYKNKNRLLQAHLLKVLEKSPLETREPFCDHFGRCGGCLYQTLPYETQLEMKAQQIRELLAPVLSEDTIFDGIKGSPRETEYRNKMDLSFGNETVDGPLTCGMHKMRTRYTVLDADTCRLAHRDLTMISSEIRNWCAKMELPFYNKLKHTGYLRYLMLRRSETTGEILIVIATSTQMTCDFAPLVERLLSLPLKGSIAGIFQADDDRYADALIADEVHCLYGRDYIHETLLGLTFKITLFSFFQTNTSGAEVLYETARAYVRDSYAAADTAGSRTLPVLYDFYCGTGTIAQIMAKEAGHVYGIEIVSEAAKDAARNAALNGLTNCTFVTGDVSEKLAKLPERPDYVILDPPREGVHEKTLKQLLAYRIPNMVYISCKASSFVADMQFLREHGWKMVRYCLVDMFPETQHVETVCLLSKLSEARNHINCDGQHG